MLYFIPSTWVHDVLDTELGLPQGFKFKIPLSQAPIGATFWFSWWVVRFYCPLQTHNKAANSNYRAEVLGHAANAVGDAYSGQKSTSPSVNRHLTAFNLIRRLKLFREIGDEFLKLHWSAQSTVLPIKMQIHVYGIGYLPEISLLTVLILVHRESQFRRTRAVGFPTPPWETHLNWLLKARKSSPLLLWSVFN